MKCQPNNPNLFTKASLLIFCTVFHMVGCLPQARADTLDTFFTAPGTPQNGPASANGLAGGGATGSGQFDSGPAVGARALVGGTAVGSAISGTVPQFANSISTIAAQAGVGSVAIGSAGTIFNGHFSVLGAAATGAGSVAIGGATAFGVPTATVAGAQSSAQYGIAIGGTDSQSNNSAANVSGTGGIAIGTSSSASATNGVAVGFGSQVTAPNSVALGSNSVANQANTVSVGNVGSERRITNVASGVGPTDAVNVSQLNQQVANGMQQANTYSNQKFSQSINYTNEVMSQQNYQLRREMSTIKQGANQGVATVAAMLTAIRTPSPGKSTISLGGGYYGAQAGTALAMAHRSSEGRWQASAAIGVPASIVSGANVAAAGAISFEF